VILQPQPAHHALSKAAAFQDLILGLGVVVIIGVEGIDLLHVDHVGLLALQYDGSRGTVNGLQGEHEQSGENGQDKGQPQDAPLVAHDHAKQAAQVDEIFLHLLPRRSRLHLDGRTQLVHGLYLPGGIRRMCPLP
jgi:hypothetical protein